MKCPICAFEITSTCPQCGFKIYETPKTNFLGRLFKEKPAEITYKNKRALCLIDFWRFFWQLKTADEYISRKTYLKRFNDEEENSKFFRNLKENRLLDTFCQKEKLAIENVEKYLALYAGFPDLIDEINHDYVTRHLESEQAYFDELFKEVDPSIVLDEEQRQAILTDEDYCLLIAGAGSGKTTTVAGKVKYLVDKKQIDPKDILIISFTNKAVNELRERINKKLNIDCPITTFHKTGLAIINKEQNVIHSNVVSEGEQFKIINEYLAKNILEDKELVKKLITFFSYYLEIPESAYDIKNQEQLFNLIERKDHSTLKDNLGEVNLQLIHSRTKKKYTINNEYLRSIEEVQIANFLYLHNIDYVYEKSYKFKIPNSKKLYTPDFCISQNGKECYIEHFGISEDGKNDRFTQEELEKYLSHMKYKIMLHKTYGTDLITTYSSYLDGRDLIAHLEEELLKKGFELKRKNDLEVYNQIVAHDKEKYFNKFTLFVINFLNNFKTRAYTERDFALLRQKTSNVRTLLFFDIVEQIYLFYQGYLKSNNMVDFPDMINESALLLEDIAKMKDKIRFKYIIVDEYQDISRQRFNLVEKLSKLTDAKIIAVGDDWQSIFAFAGSEINLFTKFKELMGYAKELPLTYTYRNAQELINIAGGFIQKNTSQISKQLKSPKHIKKPVVIYTYSEVDKEKNQEGHKVIARNRAQKVEEIIEKIIQVEGYDKSILLLARYNFEKNNLINTGLFYEGRKNQLYSRKFPKAKLTFMTVHSAKGLGFDNVIVVNCEHSVYGFPSQIEDDPIMKYVTFSDQSYEFSEERRLFYVALTRTKNRVFIVASEKRPSRFVLELIDDYRDQGVVVHGNIVKNVNDLRQNRLRCPKCHYPLQARKSVALGQNLYICTNEPEICDFMTNDMRGKGNIHLCDKCDGFMVVKPVKGTDRFIFGCTNYLDNGKGCNNHYPVESYRDD